MSQPSPSFSDEPWDSSLVRSGKELLLSPKEASETYRIPLPTIYYLVKNGKIPALRVGGRWRIRADEFDPKSLKAPRSRKRRVLVVDDDAGVQSLFRLAAHRAACVLSIARGLKEAIKRLRERRCDLVLLDLYLYESRGDQVYEAIAALDSTLPIVVITGYPDSEILHRILQHGPVTVLSKPLRVEQVAETIQKYARRKG